MEDGSTILNLLPREAHTRLCKAAGASGQRELTRIAYLYVQTLDEAHDVVELLLGTAGKRPLAKQTADTSLSSCVSQCPIQ